MAHGPPPRASHKPSPRRQPPAADAAADAAAEEKELVQPPALKRPSRDAVKEKETGIKADISAIDKKMKQVTDKLKSLSGAANKDDGLGETRSKLKALKVRRRCCSRTMLVLGRGRAQSEGVPNPVRPLAIGQCRWPVGS